MDLTEIIFDTIFTAALLRGVAMPDVDFPAVAETIQSENFAFSLDGVDFELLSLPEQEKVYNMTGTVWVLLMVPNDSQLEFDIYNATSADLITHWVEYIEQMIDLREEAEYDDAFAEIDAFWAEIDEARVAEEFDISPAMQRPRITHVTASGELDSALAELQRSGDSVLVVDRQRLKHEALLEEMDDLLH